MARRIWGQLLFEVVVLVQGVDPPEKRSIHNPKSYHFLTLGEIRSVSGGVYKGNANNNELLKHVDRKLLS